MRRRMLLVISHHMLVIRVFKFLSVPESLDQTGPFGPDRANIDWITKIKKIKK